MIKIKDIYFLFFVLITILSVNNWTSLPIGNTFFWWAVQILFFITVLVTKKNFYNPLNKKNNFPIILFLFWMFICIVRGCFVAENYWEWKNLVTTSFVLLLGLVVFVFENPILNQFLLNKWFKFILPLFFISILFTTGDAYGHYLAPILLLLLVFPLLTKKWKIIVVFLTLFVIVMAQTARSNVIKFSVALFMGSLIYYFRFFFSKKVFTILRLVFLLAPIVLFTLGILGIFNVFKMSEYIEGDYKAKVEVDGKISEESLTVDTRTGLYIEVLTSAVKNDYILLGRTPARGNDSLAFGEFLAVELNTGKSERFGNEVSILNVFTWTGVVGVVLYFFIFFRASYLAIHKSNNIFIKIIGLFVAFRWLYAWVEDFSRFDMSNIILWMLISMCFSIEFRNMTNFEFKLWVRGIFSEKFKKLSKLTQNNNRSI
ncbi:MAG: hypothetical protein AUK46_04860 [Flavobacteriaceae bacterium CG2_30_31_66]|nr:MAG: hypothetical protein AUK46_04860 [Flavobacteriaceae bacterium CG2_30_31_66]